MTLLLPSWRLKKMKQGSKRRPGDPPGEPCLRCSTPTWYVWHDRPGQCPKEHNHDNRDNRSTVVGYYGTT